VAGTVTRGQPFTVSYRENGAPAKWLITGEKVTCGPHTLKPSVIRRAEADMGEAYSMPFPPAGQQFCLVEFHVTNQGTRKRPWSASYGGTLNVGNDAYRYYMNSNTTQADPMQAYQDYGTGGLPDTAPGVNPGVSGVDFAVYAIPAHAVATSFSVPAGSVNSEVVVINLGG
jgi:hypothetical protein